jgi:TonB family protein
MKTQVSRGTLALLLAAPLIGANTVAADRPAASDPVHIELFRAPKPLNLALPAYPETEQKTGGEGWVLVNFMVDTQGKPYEVAVVESSGNLMFEAAAVDGVGQWTFEPAMLGNQPTDASMDYKINFVMTTPATGARVAFVKAYRRLRQKIEQGDRAGADADLAVLEVRNLYEDSFKALALYLYHSKWGTETQQLADLRRAVAGEKRPIYLPRDTFGALLHDMLLLQVKTNDYASALVTWELLKGVSKKRATAWQSTIDQIEVLRKDDKAFRMSGRVEHPSWQTRLLKSRFELAVLSGKVAEIKLRCDKQYVFFRYEPGVRYTVDRRK